MAEEPTAPSGPVLAPGNGSPAEASRPSVELDGRFHVYESNPAPWWIGLLWLSFLIGGAAYLIVNLLD